MRLRQYAGIVDTHNSSSRTRAMREGRGALEAPIAQGRAASDNDVHRSDEAVRMTSVEQQQLDVESNTSGSTVHQSSAVRALSSDSLHGIEAVADIHLHEGSNGDASAPDSSSLSGSGPDADDDEDSSTHAAGGDEPSYGDKAYWDSRYARELAPGSAAPPHFDWYLGYANSPLQEILRDHVPVSMPVLQVGVGTSQMQREMVDDGYTRVVSNDVSAAAVEHLRALHADVPQLSYDVADCRAMPQYQDAAFAAVVDKGTLDAILCGEGADKDAPNMVSECHRVLQPDGIFLEVSYGRPSRRLSYLSPPGVDWATITVSGVRHPQAGGEVPDGENVIKLPPLLGPYDAAEAGVLNGIEVDNYYFAYLCRK